MESVPELDVPARPRRIDHSPACGVVTAFILGGFTTNNTPQNDFGAVKLDCNIPGSNGNGYYPQIALNPPTVQTSINGLYIVGYPSIAHGQWVSGEQWEGVGRLIYDNTFLKTVNVDASGGQSGGLWAVPCSAYGWYYCQVGPHKGDVSAGIFGGMNIGHELTPSDVALLAYFRDN